MPLSWLLLLAGWKYLPEVEKGKIRVLVQSPEGREIELTERSKMHYMDQETFWAVMADIWKRNGLSSGMTTSQSETRFLPERHLSDTGQTGINPLSGNEGWATSLPEKDRRRATDNPEDRVALPE